MSSISSYKKAKAWLQATRLPLLRTEHGRRSAAQRVSNEFGLDKNDAISRPD
ncbi:TPA: hypothetical protein ACTXXA_001756 [Legionella anisa]